MKSEFPLMDKVTFRVKQNLEDYLNEESSKKSMVLRVLEEFNPVFSDLVVVFCIFVFTLIGIGLILSQISSAAGRVCFVVSWLVALATIRLHYKKISFNITMDIYLAELANIFQERVKSFDNLFSKKNLRYKSIMDKEKEYKELRNGWNSIGALSNEPNELERVELKKEKVRKLDEIFNTKIKPALDSIQAVKSKVGGLTDKLKLIIAKIQQQKKVYDLLIKQDDFERDVGNNLKAELDAFFEAVFQELQSLPQIEEDVKEIHREVLSNLDNADIDKLADFYEEVEEQFSFTRDLVNS